MGYYTSYYGLGLPSFAVIVVALYLLFTGMYLGIPGPGVTLTDVFYLEFQMKDRESRLMLVGFWKSRVRMLGLRQGLGCVLG